MTRCILTSFALCLGLACVAINPAGAAEKKAKEGQLNGRVQMIEKDKSTIMVMKGNTSRQVIYKQRHQMDVRHPGKQQAWLVR